MLVGSARVLEAVVRKVVAGEDRPQLANGSSGDALARLRLATARDRSETRLPARRRVVCPIEGAVGLVEEVDPGAVRVQQAGSLVNRPLKNLGRIAKGDDPSADLAKGALRLRQALELDPRPGELLDEIRVGHGRRGVIGEGPNECGLALAEGVDPARER